jgi:RNA polymerase sigma factor (sigma-70 family)
VAFSSELGFLSIYRFRTMEPNTTVLKLADFLAVLRGSDPQLIDDLMRRIDPFLRRVIRLRLLDGRVRHAVDTTDILQSLLKDFLRRKGVEASSTSEPFALEAWLAAGVRNKVVSRLRKERRHAGNLLADLDLASCARSPEQQAEDREFIQALRGRLSAAEDRLFDLRSQGLAWGEIAAATGNTSDGVRMRLRRAITRVLGELGE